MILNKSILYQSMPLPACMFYLVKLKSLVEKKKQHKIHLLQNSIPGDRSWIKTGWLLRDTFTKRWNYYLILEKLDLDAVGPFPLHLNVPAFGRSPFSSWQYVADDDVRQSSSNSNFDVWRKLIFSLGKVSLFHF